jgi:hypothetical protein
MADFFQHCGFRIPEDGLSGSGEDLTDTHTEPAFDELIRVQPRPA